VKTTNTAKPFLRWAGGKIWLVKHINRLLPKNGFRNYHEPFLGGGSMFLAIKPLQNAFLSDLNKELINTYIRLRNDPECLIDILETFRNTEDFYYEIRAKKFTNPYEEAARFIYLNQTSFNGIYRVNLKGEYNVPYGFRTKRFLEADKLRSDSQLLKKAKLFHGDFENVKHNLRRDDLVFLDPPYTVSHNDNGFIKYNQKLFSLDDQRRLSSLIDFIKRKGAYYILTNAAHKTIEEIFEKGDCKMRLHRANLVGGLNAERGQSTELIFTNVDYD